MTATNMDPIPPDTRPIDEMPFGSGAADPQAVAKTVRATLRTCGVNVAHEIEELGCTGAAAKGLSITQIAELRMGLAGGGVGLPCFVPPTRYCLAHSTIGGLQINQAQRFPNQVDLISRELSPRERGHVELIEASRRVRGSNLDDRIMKTGDALGGRDLPLGVELEGPEDDAEEEPASEALVPTSTTAWVCAEHRKPVWSCRYCVAQMVVDGPLEPIYVTVPRECDTDVLVPNYGIGAESLGDEIERLTVAGVGKLYVYVRAATFTRKLARD